MNLDAFFVCVCVCDRDLSHNSDLSDSFKSYFVYLPYLFRLFVFILFCFFSYVLMVYAKTVIYHSQRSTVLFHKTYVTRPSITCLFNLCSLKDELPLLTSFISQEFW